MITPTLTSQTATSTWAELLERWIDSPRRPAQSIMSKSLDQKLRLQR